MGQSQNFQKITQKKKRKKKAIRKIRFLQRDMDLFRLTRNQGVGRVKNMKIYKKTCKNSIILQAKS